MVDQQGREIVKTCPVCKVAMVRRVKEAETTLYECPLCKTEIEARQPTNGPLMKSAVLKRSIKLDGRKTSISLKMFSGLSSKKSPIARASRCRVWSLQSQRAPRATTCHRRSAFL